jgi:hypothetical protein
LICPSDGSTNAGNCWWLFVGIIPICS